MRVLVVEDEKRSAWGVKAELSADGFAVDVSHDEIDALWRVRDLTYDAIVLDLLLSVIDGYRLCADLREEGIWTPILVLAARDSEWDEVEALNAGADDFLIRPFTPAVLVARLRALMRRQPP
jgi:DNA-binding response OmpR family regulator